MDATPNLPYRDAIPVTPADKLQINLWSNTINVTVALTTRVLLDSGQISETLEEILIDSTTTVVTKLVNLPHGNLLMVAVNSNSAFTPRGRIYTRVSLQRGQIAATHARVQLCCGYVMTATGPNWPWQQNEDNWEPPGGNILLAVDDPGAGQPYDIVFGVNESVRLLALQFTFVTGAAAATRQVFLQIINETRATAQSWANATQIISLTRAYSATLVGTTPAAAGTRVAIPLPDIRIDANAELIISADNLNAADNFTDLFLNYEQLIGRMPL